MMSPFSYRQTFSRPAWLHTVFHRLTRKANPRNIEINDSISWNDFTFNVGVLFSQDKLYGQGLKKNNSNLSGFENAPGHKYLMKKVELR